MPRCVHKYDRMLTIKTSFMVIVMLKIEKSGLWACVSMLQTHGAIGKCCALSCEGG